MKQNKILGLLLLSFFIVIIASCNNQPKIEGKYVGNLKSNIDTLYVFKDQTYEHKIWNKKNKLIYKNVNVWKLNNNYILFENFLLNEDDINEKYNYDEKYLINTSLPIKESFNRIKIYINIDLDLYYMQTENITDTQSNE